MKNYLTYLLILFALGACSGSFKNVMSDVETEQLRDSVQFYKTNGKELRNSAKYMEALVSHERGLSLAQQIEDTLEIVQALNNIGTVYRRMGLLEEAAAWHYKALKCCDKWSDKETPTSLKNRVISLNGIGNVHLSLGNDDLAMEAFREALKGESKLGSATGQAINYANIGAIFEDRHQLDSARYYYGQSLMHNEASGNMLGVALCRTYFGRLAEVQENYNEALENYKSAYTLLYDGKDKWHFLQASVALTRISLVIGNNGAAAQYSDEALDVAQEIGSLSHLTEIYNYKYRLSRKLGNYRQALMWLEKATENADSLAKERNEKEIYDLRASYEKEKSQLELNHMQKIHQEDSRRKNMMLMGAIVILVLSILAICVFGYANLLRKRNYKILEDLEKTKNNYFTNIAHEFRTPLTVILSAARSIKANAVEDVEVQEDSKDIITHSTELLSLVNQVLDVAKMTSGIAPEPVWRNGNIVGFVSGICERYARYAEEKTITLSFEYSENEVEMDFVPDFIKRIVQNLLFNALKFTPTGGSVKVSLKRFGENLKLSVSDTGSGMSERQLEEIFKPFYSGAGQMGTGVGLAVVKLSVEAMGGGS
jgi:signal transduction histidine kinase